MADSQESATLAGIPSGKRHVVSQLEEGMALARKGDQAGARAIFRRIIHENPHQEDAWLWLAWVAEDSAKSRAYLKEAQAILPPSDRLRQAVAWAEAQAGAPREPGRSAPAKGAPAEATKTSATRSVHQAAPSTDPPTPRLPNRTMRDQRVWAKLPENGGKQLTPSRTPTQQAQSAAQALRGMTASAGRISRQLPQRLQSRLSASRQPDDSKKLSEVGRATDTGWARVQRTIVIAFLFVALSLVVLFAGATMAGLRNRAYPVRAMVLPTPVANVSPTPVLQQRLTSLWTQIDVACDQQDWESAIAALERLRALDPRSEEARKRLSHVYVQRGVELVAANKLGEAQEEFDKAVRLDADSEELQEARRQLQLYLNGLEAYYAQEPEQVIESLESLYKRAPNYRDTVAMLGQAHYDMAVICQDKGEWEEARDHLRRAMSFVPNMPDAQARLAEVEALITPPKRIVVDLSEQMLTIYEDNQPIHIFTVCTGRATAPTVPGRYEVLDKMPMAYASTWDLDMPWWVGIYWAGGSENGFHALPLRHGGQQVLWGSSLGRPCSFGCIVLDTDDAITLYNWVEVGTVVFVNR